MNYLQQILHIENEIVPFDDEGKLPLYINGAYSLFLFRIEGIKCVIAKPKKQIPVQTLRKHYEQFSKLLNLHCIFEFDSLSRYAEEKFVSDGIAFIIDGGSVYIPFLALFLTKRNKREIAPVTRISVSTQRLILYAIYEKWTEKPLWEIAERMSVTGMTISRAFDEIESLEIKAIFRIGRNRLFRWDDSWQSFLRKAMPYLRSPVLKQANLAELPRIKDICLGGMSALCSYTMLADNSYPTYAISKDTAKLIAKEELKLVPVGEIPEAVIQTLRYNVDYGTGKAIDPISAYLSLPEDDKTDPRVEKAFREILEEIL